MLYIVPTPIGNLGDITLRALEVLKSVDLIAAEDTRHTLNLLRHFEISRPLISYHEHNEKSRTGELIQRLKDGQNIALVSDAGTPLVSDPGYRILSEVIRKSLPYTVLPGASSLSVAVAACGFGGNRFHFGGFLPVKSGQRVNELAAALERKEFSLYFETPHRLIRSLNAICQIDPDRPVCVMRELSKQFEEIRHGSAQETAMHYESSPPKGEIVLAIAGTGKK